jgi:hypothetical protein
MSEIITCVYCGLAYPVDTPTWGAKILEDHISVCPQHPMSKLLDDYRGLRQALINFVGTEDMVELRKTVDYISSLRAFGQVDPEAIRDTILISEALLKYPKR